MKLGWKRLLKLADILDVADAEHRANGEPGYLQERYVHPCGSPACALGHYAVNNRRRGWELHGESLRFYGAPQICDSDAILAEFDISFGEATKMFDFMGCGNAKTGKQAAKYIRAFVKRKQRELTP